MVSVIRGLENGDPDFCGIWLDNPEKEPYPWGDSNVHYSCCSDDLIMIKSVEDQQNEMDSVWRFFNVPCEGSADKYWKKMKRKQEREERKRARRWNQYQEEEDRVFRKNHGIVDDDKVQRD